MDWMLMPYRRYFDFSGRSRRKEYWMFALFTFLVSLVWMVIANMVAAASLEGSAGFDPVSTIVLLVLGAWALATIIPTFAVTIRRLHDTDHSGFWILIGFIPVVGALVLLYFYLIEGTRGPNRFGPDPKEGEARGV